MSNRNRSYWLMMLASTVITVGALFGLQEWYTSYMLVSGGALGTEVGVEVKALKASQREQLASGQMPIDRAMRLMAERGRTASALVTPEPSIDPAPASGWLHDPDYVPPPDVSAQQQEQVPPPGGGEDTNGPPVVPTRPDALGTINPQPGAAPAAAGQPEAAAAAQPEQPGQPAQPQAAQPAPAPGAAQ